MAHMRLYSQWHFQSDGPQLYRWHLRPDVMVSPDASISGVNGISSYTSSGASDFSAFDLRSIASAFDVIQFLIIWICRVWKTGSTTECHKRIQFVNRLFNFPVILDGKLDPPPNVALNLSKKCTFLVRFVVFLAAQHCAKTLVVIGREVWVWFWTVSISHWVLIRAMKFWVTISFCLLIFAELFQCERSSFPSVG